MSPNQFAWFLICQIVWAALVCIFAPIRNRIKSGLLNWWSSLNATRLERRILKLEGELAKAEATWQFSEPLELLYRVLVVVMASIFLFAFLALDLMLGIGEFLRTQQTSMLATSLGHFLNIQATSFIVLLMVIFLVLVFVSSKWGTIHLPSTKPSIYKTIEDIKAKRKASSTLATNAK
jgi:hypothetical protein